ncbi:MAG: DUF748 domain-containing protein [Burkholderiales bacterium]|nr:MAG: DUF748 domain-containing protein [Burkholderiales bacterium]
MSGLRIARAIAITLAVLAVIAATAWTLAARAIEGRIQQALGPEGRFESMSLGLGHLEITGVHMPAIEGWPAPVTMTARRVVIVPELRTLITGQARVASVTIEGGYFPVVRAGDGRLRVTPRLEGSHRAAIALTAPGPRDRPSPAAGTVPAAPAAGSPATASPDTVSPDTASVGRVTLRDGTVELFDTSVGKPAHVVRIEQVEASITDLRPPALATRSALRLEGVVKAAAGRGAAADGRISVDGSLVIGRGEGRLRTTLRGVDLVALAPYLRRSLDLRVGGGALDLDLDATVEARRLHAPGRLAVSGLKLLPTGRGGLGDLSRDAAVALLEDRAGRIELDFVIDGRLDDPRFSLSEDIASRAAATIASRVGGGLGELLRGLGGAGGTAGDRAIDVIRGLLGR